MTATSRPNPAEVDLVLSGGGVKGVALAGAVAAITDAGHRPQRVSGTSAGAIIGALIAAGLTGDDLSDTARSVDYGKFADKVPLADHVPLFGPGLALLVDDGIYKGDYARDWIEKRLAERGVHTFGDIPVDDPSLPPERRYKLVVTCADVTLGQLVRLPWDYRRVYGLDPDNQPVAEAVLASMSVPLLFRAVNLTHPGSGRVSTLVDGGIVSNFPIDSLDRTDGRRPRWPTFGVTVVPDIPGPDGIMVPSLLRPLIPKPARLLEQVLVTAVAGRDQAYLSQPWVRVRAIKVDSKAAGFLDFEVSRAQIDQMHVEGYQAAEQFLAGWDWPAYVERFRS